MNPNIFENIQMENNIPSYFVRFVFVLIFLCNIPFIFLPGKECLLMIIDEVRHKTISQQIAKRIDLIRSLNQANNTKSSNNASLTPNLFVEEEVNAAKISYRIPNGIYYSQTIGLFMLQMLLAILIDDITIIFGFFAAISESSINFILPGLFYIISHKVAHKRPNIFASIGSYVFLVIGIFLFFAANVNNYFKITSPKWLKRFLLKSLLI